MSTSSYEISEGVPDAPMYVRIRAACGLARRSENAAQLGLSGTWFGVVARRGSTTIGMGRIVGDGGSFFQVVDIAVLPEHQRQGVGDKIVTSLVARLRSHAPETAYVSLIADGRARNLYARHGFVETAPKSVGMALQ